MLKELPYGLQRLWNAIILWSPPYKIGTEHILKRIHEMSWELLKIHDKPWTVANDKRIVGDLITIAALAMLVVLRRTEPTEYLRMEYIQRYDIRQWYGGTWNENMERVYKKHGDVFS